MKNWKILASVMVGLALGCTCTPQGNGTEGPQEGSVAVTGVSLSRTELSLSAGSTFNLAKTVRIEPVNATNTAVSWSSSDDKVASVNATGEGRALSEGKAVITVTTQDGGFHAGCTITVVGTYNPGTPDPGTNPGTEPGVTDPGAPAPYGALPSAGQLAWQKQEMIMFYHFGQATFSGWDGENTSCNGKTWSEALLLNNYKPTTIDADQWVKVAHDNGFKEVILTAKHHDGFCLWDNPESTADVANAKCSNHTDVVKAVRDACTKYGVNMGIYLSPWDRMIEAEGASITVYEERYKKAVKDLMTKNAPVTEFWFDGNHAGAFDWPKVNQVVLDANPDCIIFSDGGPGCRWVGNENGVAGDTNWATLNIQGVYPGHAPANYETVLAQGNKGADNWVPAECDFSIQAIGDHNGWFYGANDSRKTARELMDIYYKSVGRNGVFLMNVPPSDKGVIDDREKKIIQDFTAMRSSVFATNLADGATATSTQVRGKNNEKYGPQNLLDGNYDTYFATDDAQKTVDIELTLNGSKTFNRVMLQEYIPLGQRVESFTVQYKKNGSWTTWKSGTTIGYKRILLGSSVTTDAVRIQIKSSLASPVLNGLGLYNDTVSGL